MKKNILPFLAILLIVGACRQKINIVNNGGSPYTIIIPMEASKSDSTAAFYLSEYIMKMSGAEIPVRNDTISPDPYEICIGNTNRSDLSGSDMAPDGFRIKSMENKIFITGGEHKGTIYGAIYLLEQWGCRRFSPEEMFVPEKANLFLNSIDFTDTPANSLRIINGQMTTDPEYADWLRISTISEVSPPGYYVHTFNKLLPREKYFASHPEYFAWLGNKYSFDQPCMSHPEVKSIIIEKLTEEMTAQPGFNTWAVSQNDNFTYCQCDRCMAMIEQEGSPAGPLIRLVNDVAADFPDKTISTLAYQFSRQAPVNIQPADNVMIRLCTIELNRSKPIEDDSLSSSFVKDITDWGKICKNIYLWDYTINFNHSVSPFPNLKVLQPNLQFFYENNVRKQFPQSNLQTGHEFAEMKGKLLSALMWDPYVDLDSVKQDFMTHFYGAAAKYLDEYNDRMEEELDKSGKILYIYEPPNSHADGFLSAENIDEYNELFDQAEAIVSEDAVLLNRVKVSRLPLQYAIMEIGKNDMFGPRGWYDEADGRFVLRQDMKNTLESFFAVCRANNITTLNERSLTPETYYQSTLRFIDVQVEDNLAFRKPVRTSPAPEEKYAKGDPAMLTNGVQGAHDFNVHWLGWWGKDAVITVDLENLVRPGKIEIGTLWDGRSWILHPASVTCLISKDDLNYDQIGTIVVSGDQQNEEVTRKFSFNPKGKETRYIRFAVKGYGPLPGWHASEGEPSWFFVDEITVKSEAGKTPNDWFFMQRAFPQDEINYDAYREAFKQAVALKEDQSRKYKEDWALAGPLNLGGRLSAVAMHPGDLSTIYAGAASGGIFKSTNGGLSWTSIFDDALSLSIGDVEIAPSNPDVLYVGTGESNAGGGSMAYDGSGVYHSPDGGNSWQQRGLEAIGSVGRVVIHPEDEETVYVAAMGRLFSNNTDRGVYRTTNGGLSWERVLYISDSTGAIDLVMNAENPDIIYAAMWERIRRPDRRKYGGPTCGIYKTSDGGDSWIELTNGLPLSDVGRIGLDISISNPEILYAIYTDEIGYFKGVYKTINGGNAWMQTNDEALENMYQSYGWWFGRIHIDPTNPDIAYPIGFDLYKTEDGGNSWSNISTGVHVDQHDLVAHSLDHEKLFLGNDGGMYISEDGGNNWTLLENLPIMQFYTCEVDESFPERLYGGAQDMGTNRTMTGAPDDWHPIYGGDGFVVLVDPLDNHYVYAEYQYGGLGRSINGGSTFMGATAGIGSSDRRNWKCPLIFDPIDPSILYFGTDKLYKSTNRAVSWNAISPDLTNGPGGYNLLYGTITAIASSPANIDFLWCGTDDGNVWVSSNAGANWNKVSNELPLRWVTNIAADPHDEERAFVCFSGYRWDSYQPHAFMTEDAGLNWIDISSNLPEAPVNDIIVDPSVDSTLYVANDFGVYVSWDYGENWQILGSALPNVPVVDLRLHDGERKLIAATYGRSMYTFDLDAIVDIAEEVTTYTGSIKAYPNPFGSYLTVEFKTSKVSEIALELVDGTGKIMYQHAEIGELGQHCVRMNTATLPAGIYFLRFKAGSQSAIEKIIKFH